VWWKLVAHGQEFPLLSRLTQIGCKMLRSTETSISFNKLSMVATHVHTNTASSPTHLQLISEGRMLREPRK
jgi:hypothetical protein